MKTYSTLFLCLASALLLTSVVAQPGPGEGQPKYDPATETTVSGVVDKVEEVEGPRGWKGAHLLLTTDEAVYEIRLGPASWVEDRGFAIQAGDQLKVVGSRMTEESDPPVIIARIVRRGDESLTLRDESGRPVWRRGPGW